MNDPSPWCAVFTRRQLELLEYAEDLQEYYYSGYGNPANAKVGCLLVKDMFDMMRKVVNGKSILLGIIIWNFHFIYNDF